MASAFADVEELATSCRFPDCAHDREPGCAVRAGVDAERLGSWQKLRRELDRTAGDRAGWERAAASKKLRARMRGRTRASPDPDVYATTGRYATLGATASAISCRCSRSWRSRTCR